MKNKTLVLRDAQIYRNKRVLTFAMLAKSFYNVEKGNGEDLRYSCMAFRVHMQNIDNELFTCRTWAFSKSLFIHLRKINRGFKTNLVCYFGNT